MEKWRIRNRTSGAVEIGCVRSTALQPGESYVFGGTPPDALRWLDGARKVTLTQIEAAEVAPKKLQNISTAEEQRKKQRPERTSTNNTQE